MNGADDMDDAIGRYDFARVEAFVGAGGRLTAVQAHDWLSRALHGGVDRPPDFRQARLALAAGADVNREVETAMGGNITEFDTLLAVAAGAGDLDVARFLVENGADVNAVRYAVDDYWEEDGDDPDEDEPPKQDVYTPLGMAARAGQRDVYEYLWPLTAKMHQKAADKLKKW